MEIGNAALVDGAVPEGKAAYNGIEPVNADQENDCSDDVEIQVDHGGALGIFIGADAGDQGSNAGADVLTHDDGEGCRIGDCPRRGKRLQDTDGSRGALDNSCDHGADQHA